MLRRLTVFLRRGLFVLGVVLLVWFGVSLVSLAKVDTTWVNVFTRGGYLGLLAPPETTKASPPYFAWDGYEGHFLPYTLLPHAEPGFVTIPLYLLAFICLAWPVTSFFLHRRRRGRGFAVEATESPLPPRGAGEGGPERSEGTGEGV